jgi:dienelactone hydrolase
VTIYPGVGHAFVNPSSIAAGGAAAEAWAQILTFFEEELRA